MYIEATKNYYIGVVASVRKEYNFDSDKAPYLEIIFADGKKLNQEYQTYNHLERIYEEIKKAIMNKVDIYELPQDSDICSLKDYKKGFDCYGNYYCGRDKY